jgi:pyruvate dehydrogenase E2 component (dihydrolipoamide acetyltransferase)
MAVKVVMPQFDETMQSGKIVAWMKKEGEKVNKGEPIAQVETQKLTVEIEAPDNGILAKILAKEGDDIPILQTIAIIALPGESIELGSPSREIELTQAERKIEKPEEARTDMPEEPEMANARVPISPLARRLAREHGIDLAKIKGSGPGGRISREDVMREIEESKTTAAPGLHYSKVMPISKIRKTIAERMSYSARNAPQVTVTVEADLSEIVRLRERILSEIEAETGIRLSYTDLLVKAAAVALRQEPMLNSRLDGDVIRLIEEINIGVAVEVPEGLIVPVVRDADKKTLAQIARSTKQLIDGARDGKLSSSELTGGTFTITNLGPFGVDVFTPLINPPETAILGVGKIADKPMASDGKVEIRPMMYLSLSFDHRVIDGALAARFLQRIKQILEHPSSVLV